MASAHGTHHEAHVVPKWIYFAVFIALIILTWVTALVSRIDLGRWNIFVALAIAVIKASLVVLFFMHVRYSTRLTWAVVIGSIFWFAILIALTMGDYLTRPWLVYGPP